MAAQSGEFLRILAAVGCLKQSGIFQACIDSVRISQRWFQMPHPLELPRMRSAVVPLVRAGDAVVQELVTHGLPGLATVIGALHGLPEPAAGLRRIEAVRVGGRSLHVVDLPAGKMRAAGFPLSTFAIGGQKECAFARANQYSYPAHFLHSWIFNSL